MLLAAMLSPYAVEVDRLFVLRLVAVSELVFTRVAAVRFVFTVEAFTCDAVILAVERVFVKVDWARVD